MGALAQLGERLTGSQEVSGSNPLGSTNEKPIKGWASHLKTFTGNQPVLSQI